MKKMLILFVFVSMVALPAAAQTADFDNIVAVGDSLTAGYANGSLNETGQPYSYAQVFAEQAGHPMTLPLVSYPGVPVALVLLGFDPITGLPIIVPDGTVPGELMDPFSQPTNLAVPGQTSLDCMHQLPDGSGTMADLVLGTPWVFVFGNEPLSQADLAAELDPTFVILWIGANDVLGAALAGNPDYVVPHDAFQGAFTSIVDTLKGTGAEMVVLNIPDVTVIPALMQGGFLKAMGLDLHMLGIKKWDYVTPTGMEHLSAILQGTAAPPLTADEVLTRKEAKFLRRLVKKDNRFIKKICKQNGIPVVNIYRKLRKIDKTGYLTDDGHVLSTFFLGGLFGLDGVHPTPAGHAVVANYVIKKVNKAYGTSLPRVPVLAGERAAVPGDVLPAIPPGALEPLY